MFCLLAVLKLSSRAIHVIACAPQNCCIWTSCSLPAILNCLLENVYYLLVCRRSAPSGNPRYDLLILKLSHWGICFIYCSSSNCSTMKYMSRLDRLFQAHLSIIPFPFCAPPPRPSTTGHPKTPRPALPPSSHQATPKNKCQDTIPCCLLCSSTFAKTVQLKIPFSFTERVPLPRNKEEKRKKKKKADVPRSKLRHVSRGM